ncbi:MAG TPA: DUF4232 domain-containing protein [Acidimicrobiales bacterium]|nr:DUF4232 domain-containing protein [Acidimicrobiales bacterium]
MRKSTAVAAIAAIAAIAPACSGTQTSTTSAAAIASECQSSSLTISNGDWGGATGSMLGDLRFTNNGSKSCRLRGYFAMALLDGAGNRIRSSVFYTSQALPNPPSTLPPAVILPPHKNDSAFQTLQWLNWCEQPTPSQVSVEVLLPSGWTKPSVIIGTARSGTFFPRCDDPNRSTFMIEGAVGPPPR